jgi:hypothetical protein
MTTSTARRVTRATTINLGTLLGLIMGSAALVALATTVATWIRGDAEWKTNLTRDVAALREDLSELQGDLAASKWEATGQVQVWIETFRLANPKLIVPPLPAAAP